MSDALTDKRGQTTDDEYLKKEWMRPGTLNAISARARKLVLEELVNKEYMQERTIAELHHLGDIVEQAIGDAAVEEVHIRHE